MLVISGGTLSASSGFAPSSNRGIALGAAGGIDVASGQTLTYGGIIAGGARPRPVPATLTLSVASTYSGGTNLNAASADQQRFGHRNRPADHQRRVNRRRS